MDCTSPATEYPAKERQAAEVFALQYMRWLHDSGAANEAGPDAVAVLSAVVMKEDELRFARAPNFYNDQLASRCGISSVHSLIRARNRAIEAGLLVYEPGAKRRPGRYFVCGFDAQSAGKAKENRNNRAEKPQPSKPDPEPNPDTHTQEKESAQVEPRSELIDVIEVWNSQPESVVPKSRRVNADRIPKVVAEKFNKAWRDKEARWFLKDLVSLSSAIKTARFCHDKDWWRLQWLLSKKDGEFNFSKVLQGVYRNEGSNKSTGNGRGAYAAGVNGYSDSSF